MVQMKQTMEHNVLQMKKLMNGLRIRIFNHFILTISPILMKKIITKFFIMNNLLNLLAYKMDNLLMRVTDLDKMNILYKNHGGIYLDGFLILNKYLHSMTSKNSIMILLLHKLETKFT